MDLRAQPTDPSFNLNGEAPNMEVVGLDVSLVSSGVALISGDVATTGIVTSKGTRKDSLEQRYQRITSIVDGVRPWVRPGALVVIEGPSFGSVGGSAWDRAGLWWRLVSLAHESGCQVAVAAPTTRAKWATGSGKADKAAVAVAAARLLPDVEFESSDAADAAILALMGAQQLELRPQSKARAECLVKVTWPEAYRTPAVTA